MAVSVEEFANIPEHLNSWSWRFATFWPFNCDGDWQRVYGAKRGALRRKRDSHDKWQSQENGLSDKRKARNRVKPLNTLCGSDVMLLLFNFLYKKGSFVLCKVKKKTNKAKDKKRSKNIIHKWISIFQITVTWTTYKTSNSTKPLKACSSIHVIWL